MKEVNSKILVDERYIQRAIDDIRVFRVEQIVFNFADCRNIENDITKKASL